MGDNSWGTPDQPDPPTVTTAFDQLFGTRSGTRSERRQFRNALRGSLLEGITPAGFFDSAEALRTQSFFEPFVQALRENPYYNRALAMTSAPFPLEQESINLMGQTLGGAFLPFSGAQANPALGALLDEIRRRSQETGGTAREQFLGTASGILGGLSGAGSAIPQLSQFERDIQREESDAVNRVIFDVFNAERGRQMDAARLAPTLGGIPFARTMAGFELSDLPRQEQLRFLDVALRQYAERQERALRGVGALFGGTTVIPAPPQGLQGPSGEDAIANLLNATASGFGIGAGQQPDPVIQNVTGQGSTDETVRDLSRLFTTFWAGGGGGGGGGG